MDFQSFSDKIVFWVFDHGVRVVVILIVAWVLTRVSRVVIARLLRRFLKKSDQLQMGLAFEEKRLETLEKVSRSILKSVIWLIAIITILPEFGVNIGPLLAGLGIAGLALGFGARSLVADYISGLFILIEDQFRVGEEVDIGGTKGKVKDFNLRRTVVEGEGGVLNFIPNSQIKKASNFSRQ